MTDEEIIKRSQQLTKQLITEFSVEGVFSDHDLLHIQQILVCSFNIIGKFHDEHPGMPLN